MPDVWATANLKGGVGKTAAAINIGAYLAQQGVRTLVVDLDSNMGATLATVGRPRPGQPTIIQALTKPRLGFAPSIVAYTALPLRGRFDLVPGSINIYKTIAGFANSQEPQPVRDFNDILPHLIEQVTGDYDVIILDTGPNRDQLTDAAFLAAKRILAPLTAEPLARDGLVNLVEVIADVEQSLRHVGNQRPVAKIHGVLISKVAPNQEGLARELRDAIRQAGLPLLTLPGQGDWIVDSMPVAVASGKRVPVWALAPDDPAARAFVALAQVIAKEWLHVAA